MPSITQKRTKVDPVYVPFLYVDMDEHYLRMIGCTNPEHEWVNECFTFEESTYGNILITIF